MNKLWWWLAVHTGIMYLQPDHKSQNSHAYTLSEIEGMQDTFLRICWWKKAAKSLFLFLVILEQILTKKGDKTAHLPHICTINYKQHLEGPLQMKVKESGDC